MKFGDGSRRLSDLSPRLGRSYGKAVEERAARLTAVGKLLESYSYKGVLERGFALVQSGDGRPLTRAAQATPGLAVSLVFADGKAAATVDGGPRVEAPPAAAPEPKPKSARPKAEPKKPNRPPTQGSLF
nr:exodeoxyribonuclease VII large subunit [Azospirillum argentinense]